MPPPIISIIIPLYNQHKKLLECLESIKNQTFHNYEVIIVNDGSTDVTQQELESQILPLNFSTSQLFYQSNQGAPSARNNGFKQSRGAYVIFCDADVVMKPDMLEKMTAALDENSNVSYAYSSFKFGWKKFKLWDFDAEKLKEMPYIHTTSLIRRERFPGFDESLQRLQDWDMWLAMLKQGHSGKWIPEALFTVKTGGTMSSWLPSFLARRTAAYQEAVRCVKEKHGL
ncbi:MAG: glycosyltransferase family 2 protein [Parcubacteria group bacterium]|nr:glycosyltransferase family 2 protein [Parcubacteria group bacterium]